MASYSVTSGFFSASGPDHDRDVERARDDVVIALGVQFMARYEPHTTFRVWFEVEGLGDDTECVTGTADTDLDGPGEFITV